MRDLGAPRADHRETISRTLGHPRVHLRQTDSTNTRARELVGAGAPHGTLVSASEQTAGRGRQGRSWSAPPGRALLISLIVRDHRTPSLLPLVAGVAVCEATGELARLKWPNDVVLEQGDGHAKLAGILVEGRPQEGWAVIGIGLNVAVELGDLPPELRASAATLGRPSSEIEPILQRLLSALERGLARDTAQTLEAWRALDALRGRVISWSGGSGRAQGIDAEGRLVVETSDGARVTLDAGEVHLGPVLGRPG